MDPGQNLVVHQKVLRRRLEILLQGQLSVFCHLGRIDYFGIRREVSLNLFSSCCRKKTSDSLSQDYSERRTGWGVLLHCRNVDVFV